MKTKIIITSVLTILLFSSCILYFDSPPGAYSLRFKIDGQKNAKIRIEYIGDKELRKEAEIGEVTIPGYIGVFAGTDSKYDKRFKKFDPIYRIINTSKKDIYVFVWFNQWCGEDAQPQTDCKPDFSDIYLYAIMNAYDKEDTDPNFKPGDSVNIDTERKIKYIPRMQLYKRLIELKYPYIYKIPPNEEHIVRWGLTKEDVK